MTQQGDLIAIPNQELAPSSSVVGAQGDPSPNSETTVWDVCSTALLLEVKNSGKWMPYCCSWGRGIHSSECMCRDGGMEECMKEWMMGEIHSLAPK